MFKVLVHLNFLILFLMSTAAVKLTPIQKEGLKDGQEFFLRELDQATIVKIPEGDFFFGNDSALAPAWERPLIEAKENGYYIDRFEVSVEQYKKCQASNACPAISLANTNEKESIHSLSWEEARSYCKWVGGDLPTEAQWEYAVRGRSSTLYPWGNDVYDDGKYLGTLHYLKESTVASVRPELPSTYSSSFGIENLHDSLSEWVLDSVELDKNQKIVPREYKELRLKSWVYQSPKSPHKVLKGANYQISFPHLQRASYREAMKKKERSNRVGFRCINAQP